MSAKSSSGSYKDILLENIAKDIKQLQSSQSDMSTVVDMVTCDVPSAQALCEHLDSFFMHGLREPKEGYWTFVSYFTRSEAVHIISSMRNVHLAVGRGRAWLCMALNEQALESYVRMFFDNQDVCRDHYLQESCLRDRERLDMLQTLVSGLDYISFDLLLDCDYMDFSPSPPSSKFGISPGSELTTVVPPSFLSNRESSQSDPYSPAPIAPNFIDRVYADTDDKELLVVHKQKKSRKKKRKSSKLQTASSEHTSSSLNSDTSAPTKKAAKQTITEIVTVTEVPLSSDSPVTEVPLSSDSPVTEVPLSSDSPVTEVPLSSDSPVTEVPLSSDSPLTEVPLSCDSPLTEVPLSSDCPVTEVPLSSDSTLPEVPLSCDSPLTEVPLSSDSPVTEVPLSSDCPVTEVPLSSNSPVTELPLSIKTQDTVSADNQMTMESVAADEEVVVRAQEEVDGESDRLLLSELDKRVCDVNIDQTTRLVLSLDVLCDDSEELLRLVMLATPSGVGQQRVAYCLITDRAVYILRKDGIEGNYSKELCINYHQFEHIVIGLGWQSLALVYCGIQRCVLLIGREAVSRGIVESVCRAAGACPGFLRSIPLNRDDEVRIEAIEKELIKLGSHTSMDVVRYSLVNWEQVSGEPPPVATTQQLSGLSGWLLIKSANVLGLPVWKQAYFELRSGCLYQYPGEGESVPKNIYVIRNCGGCHRVSGESKPYTISVLDKEGATLLLAASSEDELTKWLQALCEAFIEIPTSPSHRKTCLNCALLLTHNMLHILLEDWTTDSVSLVTSCSITDLNDICVDSSLPLYCTVAYDHGSSQGVWLLCFHATYELTKFESAVCNTWEKEFQIKLKIGQVKDPVLRSKAHQAVELMTESRHRSDSVTRGRSEFTYSATF